MVRWLPWLECCHAGIRALQEGQVKETRQGGEKRGLELYGTEQVECTELSLGIDDVCKNLEHPGAKGHQRKLADVQG